MNPIEESIYQYINNIIEISEEQEPLLIQYCRMFSAVITGSFYVLDISKKRFIYIKPDDLLLCGYSVKEAMKLNFDLFPLIIHPEDLSLWNNFLEIIPQHLQALHEKRNEIDHISCTVRLIRKNSYTKDPLSQVLYQRMIPVWKNEKISYLICSVESVAYKKNGFYLHYLGTLRNQGFEMEVKANILNNVGGFSWDVTANLSTVANKIIKLPANGNENNRQGGYQVWDPKKGEVVWVGGKQEGGKLGDLFAFKQDHIFKDWDDVKANANNRYDAIGELYGPAAWEALKDKTGKQQIEPGDVCWADLNGDGVINNLDRVKVGNIFPNVTGGFSTTVSYKDFSLYARFDYALGHTLYNDLAARSIGQYQGSFNIIDMVKQSWSEENTNTDIPKFYYADQLSKKNITRSNNGLTAVDNNSSRFYEKGDYLALREITLTWNLPKRWINKAFMSNASVYVTGQNLCYFTGYSGVSPEPAVDTYYGQGIDNGRYPTPKTVLMGVSVTF